MPDPRHDTHAGLELEARGCLTVIQASAELLLAARTDLSPAHSGSACDGSWKAARTW